MRRRLPHLDRTEVGSRTRESIRHVRQCLSAIDGCRSGLDPEVERFRFIDFLDGRDILRVESRDGMITRLRWYYFCPETLAEVTDRLGLPLRAHGYHL